MRVVAAVVIVALAGQTARADDDLAEAIRLESALEYDQALAIVERILASGTTSDPSRLAELHLYAGRLAAGLDKPDAARDHFAAALELRPDLALPAGTSPKITAPFDDARSESVPLRVRITETGVVTDSDRMHLVDHVGGRTAYDVHGNTVWRGEPAPPRQTAQAPEQPERGFAARASTWAIAAGGALVIGGLCAWRFEVAQNDWNRFSADGNHDYTQLRAIETRGDHWGLAADVSFGVAAAAGVTAAIMYVVHRPSPVIVGNRFVGVAMRF